MGLFEKQLGINCTLEQIGLFSNLHGWLPQPRAEIRKKSDLFTSTINPELFREKKIQASILLLFAIEDC